GKWNFSDIIKTTKKPPGRPTVGTVIFVDGNLNYSDAALPHHRKRPAELFVSHVHKLAGHLHLDSDRSSTWEAKGFAEAGYSVNVDGNYSNTSGSLYLDISERSAQLKLVNRMLPPDTYATAGLADADFHLLSQTINGKDETHYSGHAVVKSGALISSYVRDPLQNLKAEVSFGDSAVTGIASARVAGADVTYRGSLIDFGDPVLKGTLESTAFDANHALDTFGYSAKWPQLKGLVASGSLKATVEGPLADPRVEADSVAQIRGTAYEVRIGPKPAQATIHFAGTLQHPILTAKVIGADVNYQGIIAHVPKANVHFENNKIWTEAEGIALDGKFSGSVNANVGIKNPTYLLTAQVRGVNATRLPASLRKGLFTKKDEDRTLAGLIDADAIIAGRTNLRPQSATVAFHASGARFKRFAADELRGTGRLKGGVVTVESLSLQDETAAATANGSINLDKRTVDLAWQADVMDFATLADMFGREWHNVNVGGIAHIRDGRLAGKWDDPDVEGELSGTQIGNSQVAMDYVRAHLSGNREDVKISAGELYRFPAMATISGDITALNMPAPQINLKGEFHDLELSDLAKIAEQDIQAFGLAKGTLLVEGNLSSPVISTEDIQIAEARIGDFSFQSVSAAARYNAEGGGAVLLDRFEAVQSPIHPGQTDLAKITATGSWDPNVGYHLNGHLTRLDLTELEPYLTDYITIAGNGDVQLDLTGKWKDGQSVGLQGVLSASTSGLLVNGVDLGDLHGMAAGTPAVLKFANNEVTASDGMIGSQTSGFILRPNKQNVALQYNLSTDVLLANVELVGIPYEAFRKFIGNSPYITDNPDSPLATWLQPISDPLMGTLQASVQVTGTAKEPQTSVAWNSSNVMVAGNSIQKFEGSISFGRNHVQLTKALLQADDATFNASGSLVDGELKGSLDANSLPIGLVSKWIPGRPYLRDTTGNIDSLHIEAEGISNDPTLTVTASLKDVEWIETVQPITPRRGRAAIITDQALPKTAGVVYKRLNRDGKEIELAATGKELWIGDLQTSKIVINGPMDRHRLVASDLRMTLREPDALPIDPTKARTPLPKPRQFQVYASGSMMLDWNRPETMKNPEIDLQVNVPKQRLADLLALIPAVSASAFSDKDADGTVSATLSVTGAAIDPEIRGEANLNADLLRIPNRITQLRQVNGHFFFTGDTVRVEELTAYTETVEPKSRKVVRSKDMISIQGELGLSDATAVTPIIQFWPPRIHTGASALRIKAPHIRVAESDLTGYQGARIATNDTSIDLTVTGAILAPIIKGTVNIQDADIKLPDTVLESAPGPAPTFRPVFDVAITAGSHVRIVATPVSAVVRTEIGAPIIIQGSLSGTDADSLRVNGSLVVDSGTIVFPTARFNITRGGTVSVRYPYNTGDALTGPTLGLFVDIAATTNLTASPAGDPRRQKRYTVTVEAKGPLNGKTPVLYSEPGSSGGGLFADKGLRLAFRSDPPDLGNGPADIQRRLTGLLGGESAIQGLFNSNADFGRAVRQQVAEILSASVFPGLLNQLGLGTALGLEDFSVDISQLNEFTLRLSRQISGPLYIGYFRRLTGGQGAVATTNTAAWQVKFSYRFRPTLQFSYTVDDERTNAFLLEGVFKF
ncbi:MAG: translocation/assembly module TamB domain-containing protein, partial [Chthonomonadales bacterium]